MQHSNHRTAALIASKPARIITSAALAVALTAAPMLSPVAAYAASQATQDQLSAAQQKIETATSAYNEARTKLEDLQKQIDTNEASIEKIEAELPDQQAKASSAMRDLYKYQKGTNPIVSFLVNAQSLGEFITTCKYTNQITSSSVDEIEELNKMQTELEQNKTELEQAKSQLETEQKTAEDALAQAQQLRSEAQAKAEQENAAELAKLEADKAAAAEANATAPATTHALFHTMADMASIRGRFLTTKVSLVSPDFDRTAPRRYLNDHNEAVPYRKTGLRPEDMEVFRRYGIELN